MEVSPVYSTEVIQPTSSTYSPQFGSIVIQGFGFSTLNTLLVQMIAIPFQALYVLSASGGSSFLTNTRTYWMALTMLISLVGTVMIRQIDHSHIWARFMGYCLLIAFSANFPMTLTMVAANTGGFTKKTTVNAMVYLHYNPPQCIYALGS